MCRYSATNAEMVLHTTMVSSFLVKQFAHHRELATTPQMSLLTACVMFTQNSVIHNDIVSLQIGEDSAPTLFQSIVGTNWMNSQ